jgi:hypothetical protein
MKTTLAKTDRVFTLTPRPGEKTLTESGLVDNRLFKGENRLHAIMDSPTCHWFMKYEKGGLPEPLKGRYTSFPKLVEAATHYFNSRGVDVKEILDENSDA